MTSMRYIVAGIVIMVAGGCATSRERAVVACRSQVAHTMGLAYDPARHAARDRAFAGTSFGSGEEGRMTPEREHEWRTGMRACLNAASSAATAAPASPTPPAAVARAPATPAAGDPAIPGAVSGTYRGTVSGDQRGRPYSTRITVTLAQQGEQLTGTWLTAGGGSGTVRGRLVSPTRVELHVEQLHPCPAQFTGAATIGEGGSSLGGSYSGAGCNGPVSTSFTVIRQP